MAFTDVPMVSAERLVCALPRQHHLYIAVRQLAHEPHRERGRIRDRLFHLRDHSLQLTAKLDAVDQHLAMLGAEQIRCLTSVVELIGVAAFAETDAEGPYGRAPN